MHGKIQSPLSKGEKDHKMPSSFYMQFYYLLSILVNHFQDNNENAYSFLGSSTKRKKHLH